MPKRADVQISRQIGKESNYPAQRLQFVEFPSWNHTGPVSDRESGVYIPMRDYLLARIFLTAKAGTGTGTTTVGVYVQGALVTSLSLDAGVSYVGTTWNYWLLQGFPMTVKSTAQGGHEELLLQFEAYRGW